MALGEMVFYSHEMHRNVHFRFILPEGPSPFEPEQQYFERPPRVLMLLHGHGNGNEEWITGSTIKELAYRYNLAVLMPNGENSFYLNHEDAKTNYMNYVGRELPDYVAQTFGLSVKRENMMIGGLSMGGFGALHTGLAFPERFSKIMALSSALILYDMADITPEYEDAFGGYRYYTSVFGPVSKVLTEEVNPEVLAARLKEKGAVIPEIFMACGSEDFLLPHNRRFVKFLEEHKIPVDYHESAGTHNFRFWNPWLEEAVRWMA